MSDGAPWVAEVFHQDRKLHRFQSALEAIASRESDLNATVPDQALAALREVVKHRAPRT
jgi:hypothetical protein